MFPTPKASNLVSVDGIVKTPHSDSYIVLATESGPSKLVCWIMDREGNCFWGRYGDSAYPSFVERFNRYFVGKEPV